MGVDEILRDELPNEIMLARLKAYSLINNQNTTLFLDADSLIINKLKLPDFNKFKAFLVRRDDQTSILNHNYPEYYPEFFNQKMIFFIYEFVIPINYFIMINNINDHIFIIYFVLCINFAIILKLLVILILLPYRLPIISIY